MNYPKVKETEEAKETEELDFTEAQLARIDVIHDACYDAARDAVKRRTGVFEFVQSCCDLATTMTERYDDKLFIADINGKGILAEISRIVVANVNEYLKNHSEPWDEEGDLDWDMEYIGEIADDVASLFVSEGYPVRYPYIADDGKGNLAIFDYV